MSKKYFVTLLSFSLWFGMINIAQAVPTYYFNDPVADRAAFQAAATAPLASESFEDPFATSASISFPVGGPQAFTVSVNTGTLRSYDFARLVTDGTYALAFNEYPSTVVTFNFDTAINSFGIDINDMNFGTMSFTDDLGNSLNNLLVGDFNSGAGGPGYQNLQFFGVTNTTAFSTVHLSFNDSSTGGTIAFDHLEYGTSAVPESSTLLLLGSGLIGLGFVRRRFSK